MWTRLTETDLEVTEDSSSHASIQISEPQAFPQLPLPPTSHVTEPNQFGFEFDTENSDNSHQQVLGDAEVSFSNSSGTPSFMNDLFMPDLISGGHGSDNTLSAAGAFDLPGRSSDHDLRHTMSYGPHTNLGETHLNNNRIPPAINSPEVQEGEAPFKEIGPTSKLDCAPLLADHLYVVIRGRDRTTC